MPPTFYHQLSIFNLLVDTVPFPVYNTNKPIELNHRRRSYAYQYWEIP